MYAANWELAITYVVWNVILGPFWDVLNSYGSDSSWPFLGIIQAGSQSVSLI